MTAKNAERLLILGDTCDGLLCRIYNLTEASFRTPPTLNEDVAKVCKHLVKKFPEHSELERVDGIEIFNKRAATIIVDLKDFYLTFIDVLNFEKAAWPLLQDISRNIVTFKMDVNPDLMSHFFKLFTGYIRLHILLNRVTDAKLVLSAYARAHHETHGNTEANFPSLAHFVLKYENEPLAVLREKCSSELNAGAIAETIRSFTMPIAKWMDPKTFASKSPFSVLNDEKSMDTPRQLDDIIELASWEKMIHWSLYAYLVLPAALQADECSLLGLCLKTTFTIPVFRDQLLDVHEEFDKLFVSYKLNDFKLKDYKKKIIKAAQEYYIQSVVHRSQKRGLFRAELRTLYYFFSEFPQLLAPKFNMVMCLLKVARDEVLWYFQHVNYAPYKAKNPYTKLDWKDTRVSELIHWNVMISQLILKHQTEISGYYAETMTVIDAPALNTAIDKFLRSTRQSQGIQDLLSQVLTSVQGVRAETSMRSVRLNWYRTSALLNSQQSGVKPQLVEDLNKVMTYVIAHSRNVDRVERQVRLQASFMGLFWYRKMLDSVLMGSLSATNGEPGHCVSVIQVLHQGLYNVHHMCPEEQRLIGPKAVATAEIFFDHVITALTNLIDAVINKTDVLRAQTHPVAVCTNHEQAKKGGGNFTPGSESLHRNRGGVASLGAWKGSLAALCEAIRSHESIVIYNTEFVPREWLYEATRKSIHHRLCGSCLTADRKHITRPSVLLETVRAVYQAFHIVDRHVSINLSDIMREVVLGQTMDTTVGALGTSLGLEVNKDAKGMTVVEVLSSWYVSFLTSPDLTAQGVTYSELRQSFITLNNGHMNKLAAELFIEKNELEALVTLIGPHGVRLMDRKILTKVFVLASNIRTVLQQNAGILKKLQGNFAEQQFWREHVCQLVGVNELVEQTTTMGVLLKFRRMLRTALGAVARKRTPFIFKVAAQVAGAAPVNTQMDHKVAQLDHLCSDLGMEPGNADHGIRNCLAALKTDATHAKIWALIPEMFGAMFPGASVFTTAQYLISTESHTGNVSCMAEAIRALIVGLTPVTVDKTVIPNAKADEMIRQTLLRFIKCAAQSILHMSSPSESMRAEFASVHHHSMVAFIEKFMEATDALDLSVLEDFFPYTLLRTNYIQMHETQVKEGSYAMVTEDEEKQTQ